MVVQIPLKKKYRWRPRSRYPAVGDHQFKSKRGMATSQTTVVYNPREHVLVIPVKGKSRFYHGETAKPWLIQKE